MTTITALNVRLGMDVSNFSEGANLAKGEVTRVATIMRQSVPPAEKFKQELDLLNRAFSETGKQSVQYANAVEMLNKKHQQGKYSAEEVAKAEKQAADAAALAASAKKRLKFEIEQLAKAEQQHLQVLERGKQLTISVEKAQESHNRKVREYRELLRAGAIDQETYRRAVERSNNTLKQSQTSTNSAISSIKSMAAAYVSLQTVAKAVNLASQVEDATIAFEVLTGSAKDGQLLFEQIRRFAAESPVTFSNAAEATKTMMSFGVAAQDVQKNLQMLSDVTGGNNDRFKMLALAFSQTTAAGRLMGQDLLQMINAGFNPLQQISKTTGETMIELKKRMEDGGISAQEVSQAFKDATSEGGMFNGMTERLAQTVSGKLNIALSDMEQKLAAAGEQLGPLIIQLLDASEDLKPVLEDAITLLGLFAKGAAFAIAVTQDLQAMKKGNFDFEKINGFLDRLEEREKKAELEKANAANREFQQKQAGVDAIKSAELKAAREANEARLKAIEEEAKASQMNALSAAKASVDEYINAIKDGRKEEEKGLRATADRAAKEYFKSIEGEKKQAEKILKFQLDNVEKERKARIKAIEDARKAQEKAEKQAEEAFQKELENARKAAITFFEEQQKKRKQLREDVAKGPGSGIEAGSQEAAKFAADAVNSRIARQTIPDSREVSQREIAAKTVQLWEAQMKSNEMQANGLELSRKMLDELKENGFRRIR